MNDSSNHNEREEGVLKDVLEELDRERSRRAELEEQVRKLQDEAEKLATQRAIEASKPAAASAKPESIPRSVFVSMETQVAGYQQLVDALTLGKPAIAAAAAQDAAASLKNKKSPTRPNAAKNSRKTLPLHVVRLLEVLPWDARAKQHIFAVEEVFEWQIYRDKEWQSHMRYFPTMFKTLPIVKSHLPNSQSEDRLLDEADSATASSTNGNKKDRSILFFLAGGEAVQGSSALSRRRAINKFRVITNERVTALYDMDAGYPLPQNTGAVWEWVGGWRVCKRIPPLDNSEDEEDEEAAHGTKVDCDENGWSYVAEPRHFLVENSADLIWDNSGGEYDDATTKLDDNKESTKRNPPQRKFRRRRWTRQRVLVDYLYASKSTQQYLKLLVENARLSVTADKATEQLVDTKTALTEAEAGLVEARDLLRQKDGALRSAGIDTTTNAVDITPRNRKDDDLGMDSMRSIHSNDSRTTDGGKSDAGKDFGAKFTQLFQSAGRKTSEDMTSVDESIEELAFLDGSGHGGASSGSLEQASPGDKFDWKKIGRGHLVNRFKQSQASASNSSGRPQYNKSGNVRNIFRKNSPSVNDEPAATKLSVSKD